MSCTSIDLKAYFLGEADRREKSACEDHIAQCQSCRDEFDRLRLTQSALMTLPDEEIPQRIAFVSDRVFEPRWWQSIWRSGPAMGFASALMIAGAILVHGVTRPAITAPVPQIDTARIEQRIQEEVDRRVPIAVAKAVAEVETREDVRNARLLEAAEKKFEFQRRADMVSAQETIRLYQQQMGRQTVAYNRVAGQ